MNKKIVNSSLCEEHLCTGCMACVNSCKFGAIYSHIDQKGFYRPTINEELCINCGACVNVCPGLLKEKSLNPIIRAYSCWNKDNKIRKQSSSGGFFSVIAQKVIEKGGIVYGTRLDSKMKAIIDSSETLEGLSVFRGSKYVQSQVLSDTYRQVRKNLLQKRLVLFTGTACQIAGLKFFLKKEYDNLLTMDFLCHGVPSPFIFKKYINELEDLEKDTITDFRFRDKKYSWHTFNIRITFANSKIKIYFPKKNPYYSLFINNYSLNECCFNCQYTQRERISDFTIADFWVNCDLKSKTKDDDKGLSLVLLNSKAAIGLFTECMSQCVIQEQNLDLVKENHHYLNAPSSKPLNYNLFWENISRYTVTQLNDKFTQPIPDINVYLVRLGIKPGTILSRIIRKILRK